MTRGKQTCKILKEIRQQIAAENDIELITSECTHKGDCAGTCPKCEAEVRYLERELEKRQRMGKVAVFAGMSLGTIVAATGCGPFQPTAGMPMDPNDGVTVVQEDSIPEIEEPLAGDVVATCHDSLDLDSLPEIIPLADEPVAPLEGMVMNDDGTETDVYMVVEQMPEFPGGDEALQKYLLSHIDYKGIYQDKGIDVFGRVFVNFIVEPDGSLSNVRVLRSLGSDCDEEAIRVVESMPKWNPGMQRGEAVRVSYTLPVEFKLQ